MLPKLLWLLILDSGLLLPNTVCLCLPCGTEQVSLCHVNSQRPNLFTYSYVSFTVFSCTCNIAMPFDYWTLAWAREAMFHVISSNTFKWNLGCYTSYLSFQLLIIFTYQYEKQSLQCSPPDFSIYTCLSSTFLLPCVPTQPLPSSPSTYTSSSLPCA